MAKENVEKLKKSTDKLFELFLENDYSNTIKKFEKMKADEKKIDWLGNNLASFIISLCNKIGHSKTFNKDAGLVNDALKALSGNKDNKDKEILNINNNESELGYDKVLTIQILQDKFYKNQININKKNKDVYEIFVDSAIEAREKITKIKESAKMDMFQKNSFDEPKVKQDLDEMIEMLNSGDSSLRGSSKEYKEIQRELKALKKNLSNTEIGSETKYNNYFVSIKAIAEKAKRYVENRKDVEKKYGLESYKGKRVNLMRNLCAKLDVIEGRLKDVDIEIGYKSYRDCAADMKKNFSKHTFSLSRYKNIMMQEHTDFRGKYIDTLNDIDEKYDDMDDKAKNKIDAKQMSEQDKEKENEKFLYENDDFDDISDSDLSSKGAHKTDAELTFKSDKEENKIDSQTTSEPDKEKEIEKVLYENDDYDEYDDMSDSALSSKDEHKIDAELTFESEKEENNIDSKPTSEPKIKKENEKVIYEEYDDMSDSDLSSEGAHIIDDELTFKSEKEKNKIDVEPASEPDKEKDPIMAFTGKETMIRVADENVICNNLFKDKENALKLASHFLARKKVDFSVARKTVKASVDFVEKINELMKDNNPGMIKNAYKELKEINKYNEDNEFLDRYRIIREDNYKGKSIGIPELDVDFNKLKAKIFEHTFADTLGLKKEAPQNEIAKKSNVITENIPQ